MSVPLQEWCTALHSVAWYRRAYFLLCWVEVHGGRVEEEGRAIVVVLEAEGDVSRKQGVV